MHAIDFIKTVGASGHLSPGPIVFHSSHFSPLFLFRFQLYLRAFFSLTMLDVYARPLEELKGTCETSFLGMQTFYWLKDFHLLDASSKRKWFEYLKNYKGPHTIFLFDTVSSSLDTVYALPESVSRELYEQLCTLFFPEIPGDSKFVVKLFEKKEKLSLEEASMLMNYHMALGKQSDTFFSDWFPKILIAEHSLFTLSQYLFAQQPKEFFTFWSHCSSDYPLEFWTAYWSEHVWQAALFVLRAQQEGILVAKKYAQRLPFSFINKDWKKHTYKKLSDAHHALYMLDYTVKNGGPDYGLELWYYTLLKNT